MRLRTAKDEHNWPAEERGACPQVGSRSKCKNTDKSKSSNSERDSTIDLRRARTWGRSGAEAQRRGQGWSVLSRTGKQACFRLFATYEVLRVEEEPVLAVSDKQISSCGRVKLAW